MNMKHTMVSHLQFIHLVVGAVFVDNNCRYIRIAVDIVNCKFCETLAKHCVVSFIDEHWSMSQALIGISVVHSACRSSLETW